MMVAQNGKIYAIGGRHGASSISPVNVVEECDPSTNIWTTRAPMPTARAYVGIVAASNGKLYAVGGTHSGIAINVVEEYDPATNGWATKAPMPTPRYNIGLAAVTTTCSTPPRWGSRPSRWGRSVRRPGGVASCRLTERECPNRSALHRSG